LAGSEIFLHEHAGTKFRFPKLTLGIAGISSTVPEQKEQKSGSWKEFSIWGSRIAGMAAGMHNLVAIGGPPP
jgi:hypothetical protein